VEVSGANASLPELVNISNHPEGLMKWDSQGVSMKLEKPNECIAVQEPLIQLLDESKEVGACRSCNGSERSTQYVSRRMRGSSIREAYPVQCEVSERRDRDMALGVGKFWCKTPHAPKRDLDHSSSLSSVHELAWAFPEIESKEL
jgi:hypothetical protein